MNETYHSHVLEIPNQKPFDREESRWPSFLGEFVKPLAENNLHKHYFCLYYGNHAIFRVLIEDYEKLRVHLEPLRDHLGLKDNGTEKDHTLIGSFGVKGSRFMGTNSHSTPENRALKTMASLQAVTELTMDSIYRQSDGYWIFEDHESKNKEIIGNQSFDTDNPIGNHLFTVVHLYHNITTMKGLIVQFESCSQKGMLSFYYFLKERRVGRLNPTIAQAESLLL